MADDARPGPAAGRRRRHGPLRARAGRRAVPRAAARPGPPPRARRVHGAARAPRAAALGRAARSRVSAAADASGPRGRSRSRCSPAARSPSGSRRRARGARCDPWYVVLTVPRPVLHQRIARRAEEMVRRGLIEEVAVGAGRGALRRRRRDSTASGSARRSSTCTGSGPRESVAEAITLSTRQYAKRQQTWFRHQLDGAVLDARRDAAAPRSSRPRSPQAWWRRKADA